LLQPLVPQWPLATPLATRARGLAASANNDKKDDKKDDAKKPSRWEQLKTTVREHGPVFVGYYATTYAAGFGISYGAITVAGLDGVALLQWIGVDQVFDTSILSPRVINALIAAEINETFDLVRLPFVIATTPALSRRLRGKPAEETAESTSSEKKEG
jgi:Protein of unknown function (DUF1279).